MTNVQTFASNTFAAYTASHLRIDEDANGLIALVPDQSGRWMTVRCAESKTSVTPISCSCGKSNCKHQAVVTSYYSKIYKIETPASALVVETPAPVKKVRKPRAKSQALVRKARNGGLVKVEQKPVAKVIELPVKVTDISTRGNLNGQRGFSLMR